MGKKSKNEKVKQLLNKKVNLPDFIDDVLFSEDVSVVEGTNVIRVPFGVRLSRKKRPEKNQNIATLVLPITSVQSPNPPPFVA